VASAEVMTLASTNGVKACRVTTVTVISTAERGSISLTNPYGI